MACNTSSQICAAEAIGKASVDALYRRVTARRQPEWAQMGRLVPDVVAAGEGCDVQASGHGGKNNDHPGHDTRVLEPEESRHNDLDLHSSRALTAQAATRAPLSSTVRARGEEYTDVSRSHCSKSSGQCSLPYLLLTTRGRRKLGLSWRLALLNAPPHSEAKKNGSEKQANTVTHL